MSQYSQAVKTSQTNLKEYIGKTYKHIQQQSVGLDVGCSTGYFGRLLIHEKEATVDGIEVNANDAQKARKVLRYVYEFDLESSAWPRELTNTTYDIIFFGDVLEHLKNPRDVLVKFSKLLKPTGKIIVSIPNIAHISVRLELLAGNFEYEKLGILDETHLKYFTLNSFSNLLQLSGYKIIDFDYSIASFPKVVIKDWLAKLGLRGDEKFYRLVNDTDASAYQYKFVAVPDKAGKPINIPTKPSVVAKRYTEEQSREIKKLKTELKHKDNDLKILTDSLSWKITRPLRKVRNLVKNKK